MRIIDNNMLFSAYYAKHIIPISFLPGKQIDNFQHLQDQQEHSPTIDHTSRPLPTPHM